MKTKFIYIVPILLLFFTFVCLCTVKASFEYEELPKETAEEVFQNIGITKFDNPNYTGKFNSFGASENGNYSIGYKEWSRGYVLIFDKDGVYISGFAFDINGDFYIELSDDFLTIYTVRGAHAIEIDYDGKMISVKSIPNTTENNSYWNKLQANKKSSVGEYAYSTGGIFTEYSKLTRTDENGNQSVLYEAGALGKIAVTLPLVALIVFPIAITLTAVIIIRKVKHS